MMARRVRIALLVLSGCVALGLAVWIPLNWTRLVEIPRAWEELRRQNGIEKRSEALDDAANALVRLQLPEFASGTRFQLQRLPTPDPRAVFLLCYTRDEGEKVPHPEAGRLIPESFERHHRFLRADGTLFVPRSPFFMGHDRGFHRVVHEAPSRPGLYWIHRVGGIGLGTTYPPLIYTWDDRGFVRHGFVDENRLSTLKYRMWGWDDPIRPDGEHLRRLLTSGASGDVISGLSLWRRERRDPNEVRDFLEHEDADVRASALHTLEYHLEAADVERVLADPSPRVRLMVGFALAEWGCVGWRSKIASLVDDPHPLVAENALLALSRFLDPEISCPAIFELARRGSRLALEVDPDRLAVCPKPELGRDLRKLLASLETWSEGWAKLVALLARLEDSETDAFLVRASSSTRAALVFGDEAEYEYNGAHGVAEALTSRRAPLRQLVDDLRRRRDPDMSHAEAMSLTVLHAWGEKGIEERLAKLCAADERWIELEQWPGGLEVLANSAIATGILEGLAGAGKLSDEEMDELRLDFLARVPVAVAPRISLPILRRNLKSGVLSYESVQAAGILLRWGIPGSADRLRSLLKDATSEGDEIIPLLAWPELLEHDFVRGACLAEITEATSAERREDVRPLLDALRGRSPKEQISGAIPLLEEISKQDWRLATRAALRLNAWGVAGGRERLAARLETSCDLYRLGPEELAELPKDLLERAYADEAR